MRKQVCEPAAFNGDSRSGVDEKPVTENKKNVLVCIRLRQSVAVGLLDGP